MTTKVILQSISLVAGADLSAKQFHVVKVNSSGQAVAANATDVAQVGILQDKPISGVAGSVAVNGVSKAAFGGTVASGAAVTSDANGKIVAATTGKQIIGFALQGGVSGDIGSVLIAPRGLSA